MAVLPSYLMYIYEPYQLLVYFLVSIGTTALCFALTCLFAIPAEVQVPDQETDAVESTAAEIESFIEEPALSLDIESFGPVAQGEMVSLKQTADPVFSSGAMGDGFAIEPTLGTIYVPADAHITTVFPGGHCYGLVSGNTEVLIHCGIDTVNLKGQGFDVKVKQGQDVHKGDVLCTMDLAMMKEKNIEPTIFVIFTNGVPSALLESTQYPFLKRSSSSENELDEDEMEIAPQY
ncbi:PTS glucose transporter subunit IIA [Erysipelotrichaceae bacterium RD49]|nr:PTS glucose transporter subunit IIA [Erysipelotrichaceae bacterium RD49]